MGAPSAHWIVVLAASALVWLARADLPVHCLRHQVAGEWEFTLGPLGPKRSSCGHRKPDSPDAQPPMAFLGAVGGSTSTRKFTLEDPNVVKSADGAGTWTMIYDEGFEVAVGDLNYFAFSKFVWVQDPSQENGKTNISHCDETQIGWYHNAARTQWGCYFGRKVGARSYEEDDDSDPPPSSSAAPTSWGGSQAKATEEKASSTPAPRAKTSLSWISSDLSSVLSPDQDTTNLEDLTKEPADYKPWIPGSDGFDSPMANEWQKSVAAALNFLQLGWSAAPYDQFRGKTPRELNRLAGVRRGVRPQRVRSSSFSSFLGVGQRVRRTSALDSFDWRDKDGKNWLQPVVTQGDCGSCYTISTVHMLTSRNRIRKNDMNEPAFSVSFPLYCSEYNQGCDGGYGFLQSKWSEDIGLVPESCAPFSQGGGSCQVTESCDLGEKRYRALHHHYVGGFYGGSSEESIKRELVQNGPLVISFEPKEDFMYYKSGIYRSGPNKIHQEWEQVDHAVLLVAYGEEGGQSYWTLQNSWGADWGEEGFFRMARGIDESGCESIAVTAEAVEESSNSVLDEFIASLPGQSAQ